MNKKAFTLIELIIYVAISAMVLISAVTIGMNLLVANAKAGAQREVYYNARMVMNQFQYQIRNADDVTTGSSTFGSHPGVLTLDYPGSGTDVVLDTYTKSVTIGGQSVTIRKLRIKEGAASAVDLTSDKVDVTNFTLTNLTRSTESDNIRIQLTIEKENPGGDVDYDATISLDTALSVRK